MQQIYSSLQSEMRQQSQVINHVQNVTEQQMNQIVNIKVEKECRKS